MMKHIVFMRFEDQSVAPLVAEKLRTLKGCSPLLVDMEVGIDFVRSAKSYDLAYIAVFANPQDEAAFDTEPHHQEVKAFLSQFPKTVVKVDFMTE